ncbi:TPA: lipopolysaccharide biosynthesis protein [Streptococcus suis]
MNTKSLKLNGFISLLNKVISIVCSLILPRLFITAYGSEVNGLMSSISQYLTLISLLDLGMGAVIQASMYKPLLYKDTALLSTIYYKSQVFFNRIGFALLIYIACLCLFLPANLSGKFTQSQIVGLILVLSLSHLLQFFLGITSQIILGSDQKAYIKEILQGTANILNLLLTIVLIQSGQTILIVKLASALVFILPPIFISYYVRRHYGISKNLRDRNYQIQQQWYGIGQHIAYTIQESTDIVILSMFASLTQVSVYSVYNTVFQGIKTFLNAATSGLRPFLGRALHMDDQKLLQRQFHKIEWLLHTASTIFISSTFQLVTPFVILYTQKITDANYDQPVFGYLMTLAILFYALRLPYRTLVFSKGDFKNTQFGTYFEAILNLGLSLTLVFEWQIVGVATGTAIALLFSLIYYIWYCYRFILISSFKTIRTQLLVDGGVFLLSNCLLLPFTNVVQHFSHWIIFGTCSILITFAISFGLNWIVFPQQVKSYLSPKK